MARRFWVRRESDGKAVVNTYFDSEGQAEAVADALREVSGSDDKYYVTG